MSKLANLNVRIYRWHVGDAFAISTSDPLIAIVVAYALKLYHCEFMKAILQMDYVPKIS